MIHSKNRNGGKLMLKKSLGLLLAVFMGRHLHNDYKLYYDVSDQSYVYYSRFHFRKKIKLDHYEKVSCYAPLGDDKYIAFGYNDNQHIKMKDLLYFDGKETNVLSTEFSPRNLIVNGNYAIFNIAVNNTLVAIDVNSHKRYVIGENIYDSAINAGNYVCFSKYDNETGQELKEIYAFNCEADDIHAEVIAEGSIVRNICDKLVYRNNSKIYEYHFSNNSYLLISRESNPWKINK